MTSAEQICVWHCPSWMRGFSRTLISAPSGMICFCYVQTCSHANSNRFCLHTSLTYCIVCTTSTLMRTPADYADTWLFENSNIWETELWCRVYIKSMSTSQLHPGGLWTAFAEKLTKIARLVRQFLQLCANSIVLIRRVNISQSRLWFPANHL